MERRSDVQPLRPLRSVGTKLAGATLAIVTTVTLVIVLFVSRVEGERVLIARETVGVAITGLFAQNVEAAVAFEDPKGVDEAVKLFLSAPSVAHASVFGLDPNGAPVELGNGGAESIGSGFDLSTARAIAGGVQRGKSQILVQTPIVAPSGKPVGFIRIAYSLADDNAAIERIRRRVFFSTGLMGLGLAAALITLSRSLIVRRLGKLAWATRRLQRGEHVAIDVHGDDEVGALADAFRAMSAAIESRELEIGRRNRDLRRVLDNVDAGFLTVDRDGRMAEERSRVLERWFGPAPGESFFEYVEGFAPVLAHSLKNGWRDLADDFMPAEVILDQLPTRVDIEERTFALAYGQILEQEQLAGVVVSITDATADVRREKAERAQREVMAIFRRQLDDRAGLARFVADGERILGLVRTAGTERTILLRSLHTLKGNAGVFELEAIASACHELEDRLADEGELAPAHLAKLEAAWASLRAIFDELGGNAAPSIEMSLTEHAALLAAARDDAPALATRIAALANESARTSLARAAQQTRAIARRLEKDAVRVTIAVSPPDLRLDVETWKPIWLAVPHLLRNALDHGIEAPAARIAAGKPPPGEIHLSLVESAHGVALVVADDGGGIDWTKLRKVAIQHGLPVATHADLVDALFAETVSTRDEVTEISGRGVGTSAVRAAALAAGGAIHVASEAGRGTTVTIEIPAAAVEARAA